MKNDTGERFGLDKAAAFLKANEWTVHLFATTKKSPAFKVGGISSLWGQEIVHGIKRQTNDDRRGNPSKGSQ